MGKLRSFTIKEYDNAFDAAGSIISGLLYFLMKRTLPTVIVLVLMLTGPVYVGFEYFTTEKVKLMEAKPVEGAKPIGATFSLSDIAYAQDKFMNPIYIGKDIYGFSDPDYHIWKLRDEAKILVWNSKTKAIFKIEIPALADPEKLKSFVK